MTDAIIKAVVRSAYVGEVSDRPEIIAAKLNAVRKVERDVLRIRNAMDAEKDVYEAKMKTLRTELANVQKRCGHESTTYHGDAAGGNDSYHSCDICGAEL